MFTAQGPQVLCFRDSLHAIEVALVQFAQVQLVEINSICPVECAAVH